jgi:hypothetical protein
MKSGSACISSGLPGHSLQVSAGPGHNPCYTVSHQGIVIVRVSSGFIKRTDPGLVQDLEGPVFRYPVFMQADWDSGNRFKDIMAYCNATWTLLPI